MEWKYKMIFLLLLLCLFQINKSYSQNCITVHYDKNGNRTSMFVHQCGGEYKSRETTDIINDEISINNEKQELSVYPNPNDGVFRIMIDEDDAPIVVRIYTINGVMISDGYLPESKMIYMADNPSGVYLVRVIKGECVFSEIVVKH